LFVSGLNHGSLNAQNQYIQNDLPCQYLKNFDAANLDSLMYATPKWIKGNEDCIYNILDKLADLYIYENNFSAFSCLTTVCNLAQGKISDYLIDINGSLFYAKFAQYAEYLYYYKKNYKEEHCFVKYLIAALSLQVAATKDEPKERQIIIDHIRLETKKHGLDTEIADYMMSIYNRIDPSMWDE
jgi:hypothetical protein